MAKTNKMAFYRMLSKKILGIVGKPIKVRDVQKGMEDQLGYTSNKGDIHVAFNHPYINELDTEEKKNALREGVCMHEGLHKKFTNFRYHERKLYSFPEEERQIFAFFANVVEDAGIENFAPTVMGGAPLKCLRFSIKHIYDKSKPVTDIDNAFSQLSAALIQFGDLGLIKGSFTFPEAKKTFLECAPLFEQAINSPSSKKRIDYAIKMMEISRPLWQSHADAQKAINELMKEFGKSGMSGNSSGEEAEGTPGESGASKRRKITVKKISAEEASEMMENGELSEIPSDGSLPDGDITVYEIEGQEGGSGSGTSLDGDIEYEDETGKEKGKKGKKSDKEDKESKGEKSEGEDANGNNADDKESKGKKPSKKGDKTKDKDSDDEKSDGKNSKKNNEKGSEKSSQDGNQKQKNNDSLDNPWIAQKTKNGKKIDNVSAPDGFAESNEKNVVGEIDEEEYSLTERDISEIKNDVATAEKEIEIEKEKEKYEYPIQDYPISSVALGKRSCLNYRVTCREDEDTLADAYADTVKPLQGIIKNLTTQLKRIFETDVEETERRTTGKLNVVRYNSGRVSARVFDRKVAPSGKSDFAVEMLIDESGSMSWGQKDRAARLTAIVLAEVFKNLNIPIYVMGFTADTQGHQIVHNHYLGWKKNTPKERFKLLNIRARANNCDGYSIRYATEVIKKVNANNKLLIVISDGQPAASGYYDGVADTKMAIRDAKKVSNVLGVAVGNDDTETIRYMYEKDFLHISTIEDLATGLAKKVKRLLKD